MSASEVHVRPELIDRLLALYCEWREECNDVHAAYERFSTARAPDRGLALAAYNAALDREGSAAERYAAQVNLIASRSASYRDSFGRRASIARR